jgi:hypothetical protein
MTATTEEEKALRTEAPCITPIEVSFYEHPETLPVDVEEWRRPLPGQQCPRVELDPENGEAAQLVMFGIHEMKRPLLPALFETLSEHMEGDEKIVLALRYASAVCDPGVTEILYPKPKQQEVS